MFRTFRLYAVVVTAVAFPYYPTAALDTTHNDDFWNTGAYINASPDSVAATGDMADTRITSERESNVLEKFRSTPKGLRIILF